jgi:hypothetical protein
MSKAGAYPRGATYETTLIGQDLASNTNIILGHTLVPGIRVSRLVNCLILGFDENDVVSLVVQVYIESTSLVNFRLNSHLSNQPRNATQSQ